MTYLYNVGCLLINYFSDSRIDANAYAAFAIGACWNGKDRNIVIVITERVLVRDVASQKKAKLVYWRMKSDEW